MSPRRLVLTCLTCLTCVALAASGCSGSGSPSPSAESSAVSASSLVVDGEVDQDALEALLAEVDSWERDDVDARAVEASRELELELYAASGLTEAIGGDDAAAASIEATSAWLAGLAAEAGEQLGSPAARVAPFRLVRRGQQLESFATGMWGAFQVGALNSRAAGELVSGGDGKPGDLSSGTTTRTSTGTLGTVTSVATNTDEAGVTSELRTTSVVGCPDAEGTFRASTRADLSSVTADGRAGKRGSMSVEVVGTVGDAAQLLAHDTSYSGEMADFGAGRKTYVEMRGTRSSDGQQAGAMTRSSGVPNAAITYLAALMAVAAEKYFGEELLKGAQAVWESGACVVLEPTVSDGPRGLQPGATVQITAAPTAREDGRPAGGVVTAALTAGEASVSPAEAPAVATFTYAAPSERDRTGTVSLVSRSRRGIGKAEIVFDTKQSSYVASGGGEVAFSGTVPSVTTPFSISGTFPGGTTTFAFDARGSRAGGVQVTGGGSGASLTGSGTYTISEKAGGVLLLVAKVRSCVDVSRVCRSTTHAITLTPES